MKQKSKYVDKNALIQIIGILYKEPSILEDENYMHTLAFAKEIMLPEEIKAIKRESIFSL